MRIAYAVHGYGRGHAVRSLAGLSELASRHEVLVLAGADAVPLLSSMPLVQIPCLGFAYRGGRISAARTLRDNGRLLASLVAGSGPVAALEATLSRFRPDVVVSDSEPLALRAAGGLGPGAAAGRARDPARAPGAGARGDAAGPRSPPRLPQPAAAPHARRPGGRRRRGLPAIVCGAHDGHRAGNIQLKRIDEAGFVEDLASARAVLCTAGHQLASEALYLGKPMLLCPEDSAEQRLNARELLRLGVARCVDHAGLDLAAIRSFLDGADLHRRALAACPAMEMLGPSTCSRRSDGRSPAARHPCQPRPALGLRSLRGW